MVRDEVRPVGLGDESRAVIFRVLGGESVHQELHSFWSHGDWLVWEFGVPELDFFCDRMCQTCSLRYRSSISHDC